METITNLIKDTPIPKMVRVRQNFDKTCIPESDIPGIILRELDRPEIGGKILPGQKIAITCGSRGINHNALMARTIVDFVKSKGAEPFIVAAMQPRRRHRRGPASDPQGLRHYRRSHGLPCEKLHGNRSDRHFRRAPSAGVYGQKRL